MKNTSLTRYNIILTISKRSSSLNIIPIYLSARLVACPQFRFLIFEYPTTKEAACNNNNTNFKLIVLYPRQQCDDDYPILTRGLLQRMQDTTKCRQQLLIDRRKIV